MRTTTMGGRSGCRWMAAWLTIAALLFSAGAQAASPYQLGIYYYPGWSPGIKGPDQADTWVAIKKFPEREPMLGWYRDDHSLTLNRQIDWMADAGINFVVFDWYWEAGKPAKQTSVLAFLGSTKRSRMKYSLLWANHTAEPKSVAEWDAMVDFWIANHMKNPEFLRIDGKPALFIFSPDVMRTQATAIGVTTKQLLDRARGRATAAGLPGIYFVLGVMASRYWVLDYAVRSGFDALSAYNYHFAIAGEESTKGPISESYDQLDKAYRTQWEWILKNSQLPYFTPMTSGWDKRPWGGSTPAAHDNSVSTPETFESHLRAAKALMDAYPERSKRTGMLCCWNEFGEGSYIEPTKRHGMRYLEKVQDVFGQ